MNVKQAQIRLSQLIQAAADGESVVITNHGRPVARLVPEQPIGRELTLTYGCMREQLRALGDEWSSPEEDTRIAALFTTPL